MAIDEQRLQEYLGRFVVDLGATVHAANVVIGDKLGLYEELAAAGPCTAGELADRTKTGARYVEEWLRGQAAGGYVTYEPETGRYLLDEIQAYTLTDEGNPPFLPGAFHLALAATRDEPAITEAFRSGAGVGWHEHNPEVFRGCERFFRPSYNAYLLSSWLPACEGVVDRLRGGGVVADIGCGHGASTVIMAREFPEADFRGFDYHAASIGEATRIAADQGLSDRLSFGVAAAQDYPGDGYDLVTSFDCLHDMGDPLGAARHVRETLSPHGTWMIVEPYAGDRVEDNLHPVGRAYYSFSTLLCVPNALSQRDGQEDGRALGAQAGEAAIRDVVTTAGFSRFRRVAGTPFHLVYEARP